ncbi:FAD-dependent monooxygenase [Arthrobacter sp. TWP1-1]|uniref:FAD-dependent monooxygenase n=1 Tax=Arthrobacter sp. TWP1-1 TaxID=2804568 RepID=UPI003CEFDB01
MTDIQVPVLIVGGGGAGLTASMTLSNLGIESLLVTSLPNTSILPKAHVLNQRTMEIFTEVGVAPEIYKRSTPAENMKATGWYTGITGDHDGYGRELGRLEVWGGGYTDPDYVAASSCRTCNLPQIRLEPVLRAHAESLNPGNVRFNHELIRLVQDEDGVLATVRNKDDDTEFNVRAQYLFAADGGRTVGKMLGVGMSGPRDLMRMVTVHFTADLSKWLKDDEVLIRWLVNPDFGGSWSSGVLVPMGPEHWGPASEEWIVHLQYATDDPAAMEREKVLARLDSILGVPGLEREINSISSWIMEGVISDKFREGSVFFLGDAAHRHPPTGGLGLNSAVHDAYNLCWKVASVLRGQAGDSLLDSYQAERKPVDQANIDNAVANAMNHFTIDQALNMKAENTPEQNWDEVRPLWEDLPDSHEKRHALNKAIGSQTMEFRHHNVEFGYTYDSGAIVDDGSPAYVPLDAVRLYEPSTKPGHPMPHAMVEREGERIPLISLVHGGHFLLIAGEDGGDWIEAANKIAAEHSLPIKAATVGVLGSDYVDVRASWLKNRSISSKGAVLVRPDRYIAFRSIDGVEDPQSVLKSALGQVLATELL